MKDENKVFVFQGIEYDTYQDYVNAKISRNQRKMKEIDLNQGRVKSKSKATSVSVVSRSCNKRKQLILLGLIPTYLLLHLSVQILAI